MDDILITTMNDIPGYRVTEAYGDAFGLVTRARHAFSNIVASLRTLLRRHAKAQPYLRTVSGRVAAGTLGGGRLGTTVVSPAFSAAGALSVGFVGLRCAPAALPGLWTTPLAEQPRRPRVRTLTAATRAGATGLAALALALR